MAEAVNRGKRDVYNSHLIMVCDEAGIFDAYDFLKDRLTVRGNSYLSFIYTISDKNPRPLFEQELSILEKRFPGNLIVHMIRIDTAKYRFKQELIEATLNSNTSPVMKFSVFGNAEFVNYVNGILRFLDVDAFMINSKIAPGAEFQSN